MTDIVEIASVLEGMRKEWFPVTDKYRSRTDSSRMPKFGINADMYHLNWNY
jgi:hypothetical protein